MPAEKFGKYVLLHQLAVGGMGEVWLARQSGPAGFERFIAIKRLLPNLAENVELVQMFQDEARLAARLSHSSICQVYEFDRHRKSYYLAMEYLHGETLASMLERSIKEQKPLSQPAVAYIAAQALEGLHFAHEAKDPQQRPLNLVHRDISPSNIFVTYDGQVKLLDFGIAKIARQTTHTVAGSIKGKFGYIAPEVYKGQPIDRRVDLFAMGVVLWEMLTHRRLYARAADYEILKAIVEEEPPDPIDLDTSVAPALAQSALKALAKHPSDRFQTALEMRRSISTYLRGLRDEMDAQHLAKTMAELYGQVWIDLRSSVLESFKDGSEDVANADALNPTRTDFQLNQSMPPAVGAALYYPQPPAIERVRAAPLTADQVSPKPLAKPRSRLWLGAAAVLAISISVAAFATRAHHPSASAQPSGPAITAAGPEDPTPVQAEDAPQIPRPSPRPWAPQASATLVVSTNAAGALVRLDDGEERPAPSTFSDLEPGSRHRLSVRSPGYETQQQEVTVAGGSNGFLVQLSARKREGRALPRSVVKNNGGKQLNPDQLMDAWPKP